MDDQKVEKVKDLLKGMRPRKLVKKTPKDSDKEEKKSKSKKTPKKSVEKQYKELIDPKKKKQQDQIRIGKAKRVASELSKKNVDMKKIEKILDKLSPIERSRRNLIEKLLENSEDKEILAEIIEKAQRKDGDFADILGSFSKKKLLKALEEFVSQKDTTDSLGFLEEYVLADPVLKLNYENILKEKEEERLERQKKREQRQEKVEEEEEEETTDEEREDEDQQEDLGDDFGDSRTQLVLKLVELKNDMKEVKKLIKKYEKKDSDFAELLLSFNKDKLVELLSEVEISPPYDITQFFEDKLKKTSPKKKVKPELKKRRIQVIIDPELEEQFEKRFGKKEDRKVEERAVDKNFRILGVDQFCLLDQALKPWIRNYVSTWLSAPDGEELDDKYVTKYVGLIGESVEHEGRRFYKANTRFNYLQCNYLSKNRKQDGNILTLYEDAGKPVRVIVLHELRNDFIIQDEKLFDKEVEYLAYKEKDETRKLNYFISKKFDTERLSNTLYTISYNELHKYAGKDKDTVEMKQYINNIIKNLMEKYKTSTIGEYLLRLALISIYLDPNIMGEYAENFNNKFQNRFYNPSAIDSLTNKEKIPEVFLNKDFGIYLKGISDGISQRIDYYKNLKREQLARLFVREVSESVTGKRKMDTYIPKLDLELPELKSSCENTDITSFNMWEYIPYEEDGKVYCISIYNKLTDTNPYTGNKFSDEFMEYLAKLDQDTIHKHLNIQLFGDDLEEKEAIPIPVIEEQKSLAPGLIELLYKNLSDLEENLVEGKVSEEVICSYCKDHILSENPLKTLVTRKENSKIVKFCSVDCFEKWNPKLV